MSELRVADLNVTIEEEEDEDVSGYLWEKDAERTWENVKESEGRLTFVQTDSKRRKLNVNEKSGVKRGMTRYLFLVVDFSKSMNSQDFKPSRWAAVERNLEMFVKNYFDQNPLSHMGLIVCRNAVAEKVTELSGNSRLHIDELKKHSKKTEGELSLQNALIVANSSLSFVPDYGTREVVFVVGSLTSCDPSDIFQTIEELKKNRVTVSIIGFQAEVFICRSICEKTGGKYNVAVNEDVLRDSILQQAPPPPSKSAQPALISMGFPQRKKDSHWSFCVCHKKPKKEGYFCPRCNAKCCELPIECPLCGLTLISSSHLARSYHHLFPVPIFEEILLPELQKTNTNTNTNTNSIVNNAPQMIKKITIKSSASNIFTATISPSPSLSNLNNFSNQNDSVNGNTTTTTTTTTTSSITANNIVDLIPNTYSNGLNTNSNNSNGTNGNNNNNNNNVVKIPTVSEFSCFSCLRHVEPSKLFSSELRIFRCPKCSHFFCSDCDTFIHDSLQNCPGCENGN